MNILVNTQLLIAGKMDGIGWFTYETIKRITQNHPQHTFYLIFDRKPSETFRFAQNVEFIVLSPQARHPLLWFLRFEILLPFLIKKYKADVFVTPDGWMSHGISIPCVQVIHDLNFIHYPKDTPFLTRKYYSILFPRYARRAKQLVTVSEYSKQDIVKTLGVSADKIDVAYNGCNSVFKQSDAASQYHTRQKYTQGTPYFLYVGAIIPRKNIARLLQAFDLFKEQDSQHTKLIMVGNCKWWTPQINDAYQSMKYRHDVIFTGRLEAEQLNELYGASLALTFVPYFEGFGIPILEAFNAGTAVITSNVTSMPEVAGDAALLVDPFSVGSITKAMIDISTNAELRKRLIAASQERAKLFSWDNTARVLWEAIEKAAGIR
jgi:glycosyltransferase involved in cell wall biosynthesis